jgi:hypothetical protein
MGSYAFPCARTLGSVGSLQLGYWLDFTCLSSWLHRGGDYNYNLVITMNESDCFYCFSCIGFWIFYIDDLATLKAFPTGSKGLCYDCSL